MNYYLFYTLFLLLNPLSLIFLHYHFVYFINSAVQFYSEKKKKKKKLKHVKLTCDSCSLRRVSTECVQSFTAPWQ